MDDKQLEKSDVPILVNDEGVRMQRAIRIRKSRLRRNFRELEERLMTLEAYFPTGHRQKSLKTIQSIERKSITRPQMN
jgi:hypothetical protein